MLKWGYYYKMGSLRGTEIIYALFFILLMVSALIAFMVGGIDYITHLGNNKNITTTCYDKFGSEINGVTCNKTVICGWGWGTERC